MTYPEYKTAAERHLETCWQLLFVLEEYKRKQQANTLLPHEIKSRNKILGDLYYLAGYIIECSYSCSIFHKIGFPNDIDVRELEPAKWSLYSISYDVTYRKTSGGGTSNTFVIANSTHTLSGRMDFFISKMGFTPPIVLLNGYNLLDSNNNIRPASILFDNWNAEIRYTIDSALNLNYDNVSDFFYLATEVYEGLVTNSMI